MSGSGSSSGSSSGFDWLSALGAVGDITSGVVSGVQNRKQFEHQKEVDEFNMQMAQKNYQLAVDQMNWQQEAQQTAWSREDNAIRRRVADLEAAGMSKWQAAGQGAQAGGITASNVTSGANMINSGARYNTNNFKNPVDTFLAGAERQAGISLTQKQEELVQARIDNEKQDTVNKSFGANKIIAETEKIYADMKNTVEELSRKQRELDEQIKLWESQKNKNSVESKRIKADIQKTAVETSIAVKEFKMMDSYFNMAKEEHKEKIKSSQSARALSTSDNVRNWIYGLNKEVNRWLNPFAK